MVLALKGRLRSKRVEGKSRTIPCPHIQLTYIRLIYDVEFDDNLPSTLKSLNIKNGSRMTITNDNDDEPDKNYSIILMIQHS